MKQYKYTIFTEPKLISVLGTHTHELGDSTLVMDGTENANVVAIVPKHIVVVRSEIEECVEPQIEVDSLRNEIHHVRLDIERLQWRISRLELALEMKRRKRWWQWKTP